MIPRPCKDLQPDSPLLWCYPAGHGSAPQHGHWVDALGRVYEYCSGMPPLCRTACVSAGAHRYCTGKLTAPHGEAGGFAPDLLARRSSGGTCTHWVTTTSFIE